MIRLTGSSNYGHGICCNPEAEEYPCVSDDTLTCSYPVFGQDDSMERREIWSAGMLNH